LFSILQTKGFGRPLRKNFQNKERWQKRKQQRKVVEDKPPQAPGDEPGAAFFIFVNFL
jgi:hypothetical protein